MYSFDIYRVWSEQSWQMRLAKQNPCTCPHLWLQGSMDSTYPIHSDIEGSDTVASLQ